MQGLTALTAIAGYQTSINEDAQATPEERSGGTVDPKHGHWDPNANRVAYESQLVQAGGHGPYGPESQLLDDDEWHYFPAGNEMQDPYMDRTPSRRAGPWPKGIASPVPGENPDDIANQLRQSMAIHAIKTNAAKRSGYSPLGDINNDTWGGFYEVDPGHTDQQPIGRQAMSSGYAYGTRDREHSFARQNEYGFDSAHKMRRYATGSVPGNYMYLEPGGRPLSKSLAGPARPAIGPDSPFGGQDLGQSFSIDGAILQTIPSEYVAPPQPELAPAVIAASYGDAVVEWY